MKNIIILLLFIVNIYSVSAQSVVIDIKETGFGQPVGYYLKDINNVLNQFEGTYVYTNGSKTFKITLVKKIKQYNSSYYEDLIIGEYQYLDYGNLVIQDTMPNLNVVYNNQFIKHAIAGNSLLWNTTRLWKCPQCAPNERRLDAKITDVSTARTASFFMRKTIVNGQEVLQVKITNVLPSFESMTPPNFSLPLGEFTMIKQ